VDWRRRYNRDGSLNGERGRAEAAHSGFLGVGCAPERIAEWGVTFGYSACLFALSALRYRLWLAFGLDLGFFEQGLWLLTHQGVHGVSTYTGHSLLADAASYILVLIAPIYDWAGVYALLLLQAFAFGIGYLFIRRIARALGADNRWARVVGIIYMAYPTVIAATLFDFHPDAFGIPILFGLLMAALKKHWLVYAVLLVASILVKDTVPIVLVGLGVALTLQRMIGWGVLTAVVGLSSGYLDVQVIIPMLQHVPMTQWHEYYGYLGTTPLEGISNLLRHPALLLGWTHRALAWTCLAVLLGPFAVLFTVLGSPVLNVWWLPGLALCEMNLLSPSWVLLTPFNEMYVLAIPFFFTALIVGLARYRGRPPGRGLTTIALVPVLLLLAWYGLLEHEYLSGHRGPNIAASAAAVAAVPKDAPVFAQSVIVPHLSPRPQMWETTALRNGLDLPQGTYVVLDPQLTVGELISTSTLHHFQERVARTGQSEVIFFRDGVTVYRLVRPLTLPPMGR
jgi:hypothetical protein